MPNASKRMSGVLQAPETADVCLYRGALAHGGVPDTASPLCARKKVASDPLRSLAGGGPKCPYRRVPRLPARLVPFSLVALSGLAQCRVAAGGPGGWGAGVTPERACERQGRAAQRPPPRCYGSELNRVGAKRCHQGGTPPPRRWPGGGLIGWGAGVSEPASEGRPKKRARNSATAKPCRGSSSGQGRTFTGRSLRRPAGWADEGGRGDPIRAGAEHLGGLAAPKKRNAPTFRPGRSPYRRGVRRSEPPSA